TGDLVAGGAAEQTERVIANIKAVLKSAGTSLDNVVKATVFLKDLNDFGKMNEVYAKHFPADNAPARSTIQVARLPKDSLVEIEVVAVVP
ncbi:MAG: deaminase, partial [Candidatus Omnitrophica bacterium CG12_big_fil_rev_8_21_14_0_65_50_5]